MSKIYSVYRFLTEENKRDINAVCDECGYEIVYFDTPEEAEGKVADGDILFCTNPAMVPEMPGLRWCHSISAGVDAFVQSGCFDSGDIVLTNSSGVYGRAISEHVIMVTLMLMRRIPEYEEIIAERDWRMHLQVRSIADSVIAIVGTGNIGQSVARRFRALGASRVIGFNRSGRMPEYFDETYRMDEFTEHVSDVDVLVMCVPGTPETRALLDADRIAALPARAFVVNVGRGTSVDQDALIRALEEERIAGAALDVVYPEPLPRDHPLWTVRNCILTPHCSGDNGLRYTVDRAVELFCDNLRRYAGGQELINVIDPEVGY